MPTTRDTLLSVLAARPGLTQTGLAARLDLSTRTMRRHLAALERDGLLVVTPEGAACRYRLRDGAQPAAPLPRLTEDETEALAVATLAARALLASTPLARPLATAAEKLRVASLEDTFSFEPETDDAYWSFDGAAGGEPPDADAGVFRALLTAAREQRAVRADYFTASRRAARTRRLGPLGFFVRSGAWLVPCVDLDAPGRPVKDFALAGFRAAELLLEHVLPPPGFSMDGYTRDRFAALDGAVETVRLLASPEAAPYFDRKRYTPTQQVEEVRSDGSAVVSFETSGLDAVAAFVLSWGAKVQALEPAVLVEAVAEAHTRAAALYETVDS
jgi:predicted DNA-binding transcriptional regulator YafY